MVMFSAFLLQSQSGPPTQDIMECTSVYKLLLLFVVYSFIFVVISCNL